MGARTDGRGGDDTAVAGERPLRLAVDARIQGGGLSGGIEQVAGCLVYALAELGGGDPEEIVVVADDPAGWLTPYLGRRRRVVTPPPDPQKRPLARRLAERLARRPLHASRGFYESLEVDLVHFAHQRFVQTDLPTVYSPHDLQHRHLPGFFTRAQVAYRERVYRDGCRRAGAVVVHSVWVKEDVVQAYGVPPERVHIVHHAAPTALFPDAEEAAPVRAAYDLPPRFALYPAQTWPHKNHIRLLDALSRLRHSEGLDIALVCTGHQNAFWPEIERHLHDLDLETHVRFLGYVPPRTLQALYGLADFVFLPSLFEGGGLPVLEAFEAGTPVACSAVTSLPEYAGDAALLFDPTSVPEIADAWSRMARDDALRAGLASRGRARAAAFTWDRAVRTFRALYRRVAGLQLTRGDELLLETTV